MSTQSSTSIIPVRYIRWMGNNFGDNINDVLFQDIFGIKTAVHNGEPQTDGINLLGIGTLLNEHLNLSGTAKAWVIGSGAGNARKPELPADSKIFFVRGPLTCQFLNWPKSYALADAAYLLADKFYSVADKETVTPRRYGIIPHHFSGESNLAQWKQVHQHIPIISPYLDWQRFIQQVNACDIILTECLHGAIAADILRKPFIAFATTPHIHLFKWLDWASSMDIKLTFNRLDFDDPEALCKSAEPVMSTQETFDRVQNQLEQQKVKIQRCLADIGPNQGP
jgi:succinoglycan biosynthesis protein ExoV